MYSYKLLYYCAIFYIVIMFFFYLSYVLYFNITIYPISFVAVFLLIIKYSIVKQYCMIIFNILLLLFRFR